MCVRRYLGFVLLVWFPGALHAQSAAQSCRAPRLNGGYLVPEQDFYPHETKLTYSCDNGFKPVVEGWWAMSTCLNRAWSHEPQCIDENACLPPTVPNAESTVNTAGWYEEGRIIRITCHEGYEHKGWNATAECVNGTWISVPICQKRVDACGEPPQIPHAVVIHREYQEVYPVDTKVQYECEDGYTVEGADSKKFIYCIFGNWTEGPTCKSDDACGEPPQIPHAVVIHWEFQEVYPVDTKVQYECEDGYTVEGADSKKFIFCKAGNWTEGPTCSRRTRPGTGPSGSGVGGAGQGGPTSTGSVTQPAGGGSGPATGDGGSTSAGSGTKPVGGGSSDSGSDKKEITYEITTISVNNCGKYPIVPNGDVVEKALMYARYQCADFYTHVGPEAVVCFSDGLWSEAPTCKATFCSLNTDEYPQLIPDGVKHLRDGDTERFECVHQHRWWSTHYSVVRCRNARLSLSKCCGGWELFKGGC